MRRIRQTGTKRPHPVAVVLVAVFGLGSLASSCLGGIPEGAVSVFNASDEKITIVDMENGSVLATLVPREDWFDNACNDAFVNDRVRDVTDLAMIRREFFVGKDLEGLRETCIEVFAFRAAEAEAVGAPGRRWPPVITSNERWEAEHQKLANATGADIPLDELVEQVNTWIITISSAAP